MRGARIAGAAHKYGLAPASFHQHDCRRRGCSAHHLNTHHLSLIQRDHRIPTTIARSTLPPQGFTYSTSGAAGDVTVRVTASGLPELAYVQPSPDQLAANHARIANNDEIVNVALQGAHSLLCAHATRAAGRS
jgi:hypothetical protein